MEIVEQEAEMTNIPYECRAIGWRKDMYRLLHRNTPIYRFPRFADRAVMVHLIGKKSSDRAWPANVCLHDNEEQMGNEVGRRMLRSASRMIDSRESRGFCRWHGDLRTCD